MLTFKLMPRKFTNEPIDPPTPFPAERNTEPAEDSEIEGDTFDLQEPVSAPRGLMRKTTALRTVDRDGATLGRSDRLVLFGVITS